MPLTTRTDVLKEETISKSKSLKTVVTVTLLACCSCVPAQKQFYKGTWESLEGYKAPEWHKDAKFGIFIHWGPYAVPGFDSEWYPHNMYDKGSDAYKHHKNKWGDHKQFGYKDFIAMFKAEKFDADAWAELFEKAGAKYVVPVACHHDGFAMYDSSHTKWNSVNMGPTRDVVGELAAACRKRSMKFGASTHYAMNWDYYAHRDEFDTVDPACAGLYNEPHPTGQPPTKKFLGHWYARTVEIVDKYKPDILWFDFGFFRPAYEPYRRKIAAYYYNKALQWQKGVVLNYKDNIYPFGTAILDLERTRLQGIHPMVWQTDTSLSLQSWGYIKRDRFKTVDSLIDDLVDIVSKNGVLLLNVGPKPDGTIPVQAKRKLRAIGRWLDANGQAIYGTRPWLTYGEGPLRLEEIDFGAGEETEYGAEDIRFTAKANILYAICLGWPEQRLKIRSLGTDAQPHLEILHISLLGSDEKLKWQRQPEHLAIQVPEQKCGGYAHSFRIELDGVAIGAATVEPVNNTVKAQAKVINYSHKTFSTELSVYIDQKPVKTKMVAAAPGTVRCASFTHNVKEPKFYSFAIGSAGFSTPAKKVTLPVIDLAGTWLFKKGDSPDYKQIDFDDSDWRRVTLPMITCPYTQQIDFHWLRKKIFVPQAFEGCGLLLTLGKIDGASETYFNGERVGRMSRIPFGDERPLWEDTRRDRVRPDLIKFGQENLIAVRIYGLKNCGMYADMAPVEYIEKWQEQDEDED